MRPGLAVSIIADPPGGADPSQGSVLKVDGKEVVVLFGRDRGTPALQLKPRQKLRISYRNQADGAIYFVPAEVKAKDGPRSLALKLLGPPALGEERDQPRVEQLLRMDYEVVPPREVETARMQILRGAQIVKYESQGSQLRQVVAGQEGAPDTLPPALARYLGRIERKIDVLIERLGVDAQGIASEKPLYNVNLSTRGLRFRDIQNRCAPGATIRLLIELPLDPTVEVIALGEVLRTVDTGSGEKLSMGRDVVIEFKVMRDTSRQAIERFCHLHDAKRRTA